MAALDDAALNRALAIADAPGSLREAAAALRAAFGPLRVVVVDAFEMRAEAPVAIGSRRLLYLGASDGHCWTVTREPAQAAGFFIADKA
jgi:hypothetical protein